MEVLSCQSLNEVKGGGKSLWFLFGGVCALLSGLVAGFFNPTSCHR